MAKLARKKKESTAKNMLNGISSTKRLEKLLEETEKELGGIQPKIERLEKQLERLHELKLAKQKLITLKLSLKSILENYSKDIASDFAKELLEKNYSETILQNNYKNYAPSPATSASRNQDIPQGVFLPENALNEAGHVLRQKGSLNFELFRAVVFGGGKAYTEEIKQYLVENNIAQPGNGNSFEEIPLTDISARVNYLVKKGLVRAAGRGLFVATVGWSDF